MHNCAWVYNYVMYVKGEEQEGVHTNMLRWIWGGGGRGGVWEVRWGWERWGVGEVQVGEVGV